MSAKLKKYNLEGEEKGVIDIPDELAKASSNLQMIKDYLVALRANKRQWSANTKTRSENNHSKKKPRPQKGTGNARQGFLGAPQFRGGGRVMAPRPKFDQHVRINKKERRSALRHLMVEKMSAGKICVLEYPQLDEPKTKRMSRFLDKCGLNGKRVLFLAEGAIEGNPEGDGNLRNKYENFVRSLKNMPKTSFMYLPNLSGYEAALNEQIVLIEPAVDELKILLKESK